MAIKTYAVPPYNDDFNTNSVQFTGAEGKNYLRILFKPGVSVQVRELNQMQSILQSQIDKFGQSVYKEGPVLDGEGSLDNNAKYIDITLDGIAPATPEVITTYLDQILKIQTTNGLEASVLRYEALAETNTYRFFIRYNSSVQNGSGNNIQEFVATDVIELDNAIVDPNDNSQNPTELVNTGTSFATVASTGHAAVVKTKAGVYFVNGEFVYNEAEELYFAKPSEDYTLNGKVAFIVTDTIVTYVTDPLLLDNATGYPNETAPGADRYKIDFQLAFLTDLDDALVTNNAGVFFVDNVQSYITLFKTDLDVVVKPARTEYTQLDRKFADRTSEESGDYCLKPFKLDLREYLNDEVGNRGRYSASDITDLDDIEKIDLGSDTNLIYGERHYLAGLEPSIAYVQGYRVHLKNKKEIQVEKARDTEIVGESFATLALGNYVVGNITGGSALPDFSDQSVTYAINMSGTNGTCKVRSLEKISAGVYHLYIYDVNIASGFLGQATSISTATFTFAPLSGGAFELLESNDNNLLFPLPYDTVKSIDVDSVNYKYTQTGLSGTTVTAAAPTGYSLYSDATSNYIGLSSSGAVRNLTTIPDTATGSLTFDGAVSTIIFPIQKTTPVAGTKTRINYTHTLTLPSVAFTSGSYIDLPNFDIYDIVSITEVDADGVELADYTSQFTLDDGQRDNYYQDGKITYTGSTDLNGKKLSIVYRYFNWNSPTDATVSQKGDFFCANSYVAGNIEYNEIPTYGNSFLADVLDFRPYINSTDSRSTLDPDTVVEFDEVEVFLPRYDKVVVSNIGDFGVVKGTPSLDPIVPQTPGDSMALYELFVPAYTFDASDITTKFIDNRRYTMRDIGTIEKRVKNLEYYTSLSLLEQEASEKKIFTEGGEERFKNGILVDSFVGHNVGNPFDSDYKCAIEPATGILRPSYSTTNLLLGVESAYRSQETVSLSYTEVPLITQPYASVSESVNPFDLAAWLGVIKLNPSTDEWKETRVRPDVIVNSTGSADAIQFLAQESGAIGTKWSEWETDWTGVDSQVENVQIARSDKNGSAAARRARLVAKRELTGSNDWRPLRGTITTTTTTSEDSRDGIRTTMSFRDQQENLGERVVDVSFVPFIRSRRIEIHGEMFKPLTKMYVFFDGVDISEYCTKLVDGNGDTAAASTPYAAKNAAVTSYLNDEPADIAGLSTRVELITDAAGRINVACFIPNNAKIKFKTGERNVTLTDSPKNSITEATTYSFATYNATGLIETKQSTILSTRIPEFDQQRLSQERTLTGVDRDVNVRYYDPLAQSFVIGEIPTGTSVTKVDLFFQKKHASIPITTHLVTVENGIPTQNVVPFSKVVKNPTIDTINVTEDASVATSFVYDAPVYLQPGVEYAIVVLSNSPDYRLWMAETGGDDVNGQGRIDKNPYAGVSFKSQNASTWTPDQNRDFKFTLHRARYDTDETKTITFNGLGTPSSFVISNFVVFSSNVLLPKTTASASIKFSASGASYPINFNSTEYLAAPITVANASQVQLTTVLSTTSEYIAPLFDLSRLSLLGISNIINNPTVSRIISSDRGIITGINATTTAANSSRTASTYNPVVGAGTTGGGATFSVTVDATTGNVSDITLVSGGTGYSVDEVVTIPDSLLGGGGAPDVTFTVASLQGLVIGETTDTRVSANDGRIDDGFAYLDDSSTADVQYITRTVTLNDPADRLNIYLLGNRPSVGSNIRVLIKLKIDDSQYDDVPWEEIRPTKNIPVNSNGRYSEIEYDFDAEALEDDNPGPADPRFGLEFTAFAVKIVLTSTDIVNVPTVRDFRAIATFD
jgi:hypothetical protein